MSFRGGRDRPRRGYPSRSEERGRGGRSTAPPSRHLWVGNLSQTLTERLLSDHFRDFGELESVAFQPGRSYAFINFIDEGAAFAAFEALQGFILAGNALRIEFTKAEKSAAASSHGEGYLRSREEPRSSVRESPFPQRDSRPRHINADPFYHNDNSKTNSKNAEEQPSEVLWVGFPQSLRVDEDSFWNAFSPFGEIEKISAFPGRTYAFIRFKHVNSAIRAKDNLQGQLFNNPRVHITFAKSDSGPSNNQRNLMNDNDAPSPRGRPYGRQGSFDNFRHDNYQETERIRRRSRSPRFSDNRPIGRFQELAPDNMFERHSPLRDRMGGFHDLPPPRIPRHNPHQGPIYDDEWDLPEDALVYHGANKLKSSMVPHEPELPEYPFSETEQVKHVLHQHDMIDDNNLTRRGYHRQNPDPPVNMLSHAYVEQGNNSRNASSYDGFQTSSVPLPQNPVGWKRSSPEPKKLPASGEWKWEGVIAKGGTSICRARCFPVGKVLDMILPEYLDCTARTSLDMLAKHYYQAASSWVVFFVPESDADMGFYNEFMNYLGEKQRAAVAKLDDKTTLFLVPPSDFSEKILKVPGKLSISGVILRLDLPSSNIEALPPPPERPDPYLVSHEVSRTSFASASGPYLPPPPGPPGPPPTNLVKSRANMSLPGMPSASLPFYAENIALSRATTTQETGLNNYRPQTSSMQYSHQETGGVNIQPDQLAQLASILGNTRQSSNTMAPDNNPYRMPQTLPSPSPSSQMGSDHHQAPHYHQTQQFQQQQQAPNMAPQSHSSSGQGNAQGGGGDADPQKRLQATLELAATLLKQIQQGKN